MKKIFFLLAAICLCLINISAQIITQPDSTMKEDSEDIFTIVEQWPQYTGGENAMNDFLNKNLTYPKQALRQGIQGKVWLGFIVNKEGKVSDVEVLRGIGGGCDEEAVRVIKLMPDWIPGRQSGKPVSVKYKFPINFTLR